MAARPAGGGRNWTGTAADPGFCRSNCSEAALRSASSSPRCPPVPEPAPRCRRPSRPCGDLTEDWKPGTDQRVDERLVGVAGHERDIVGKIPMHAAAGREPGPQIGLSPAWLAAVRANDGVPRWSWPVVGSRARALRPAPTGPGGRQPWLLAVIAATRFAKGVEVSRAGQVGVDEADVGADLARRPSVDQKKSIQAKFSSSRRSMSTTGSAAGPGTGRPELGHRV